MPKLRPEMVKFAMKRRPTPHAASTCPLPVAAGNGRAAPSSSSSKAITPQLTAIKGLGSVYQHTAARNKLPAVSETSRR